MKTLTAYTNQTIIFDKDDIEMSVEKGKFDYNGKKWKFKTTFKSRKKINRVCGDYNLGTTYLDNTLVHC